MLCCNGHLRNGSVATPFILLSATGGNIVVPKRLSKTEEPTSRNEEPTRNVRKTYLFQPQSLFNEKLCILLVLEHEMLSYLVHLF